MPFELPQLNPALLGYAIEMKYSPLMWEGYSISITIALLITHVQQIFFFFTLQHPSIIVNL